ncbi:MAG TPA: DNA polymerase III subunit delta, partial [Rhizobiales bacterium]|nr:DNA polymerase III subunit delta [Hyphomicrobiales bacterium]
MKITWKQIEPFVKSPDPKARVVLVYGPDSGLMRERAKSIGLTVVSDDTDPFNVAVLSAGQLAEDPARLSDEANAISMMGGGRLIRVEDAGDKLTVLIKSYLENPSDQNLVILEAGELGPRSSLRKACEAAKNAAALPCYVEDERDLSRLIRETLQEANLSIDPDAVIWLAGNLAGNRGRVRSELTKLITYKGAASSAITLEDAQNICGEAGVGSLDTLIYSTAGGHAKEA